MLDKEITLKEFKKSVKKVNKPRKHTVTNSYGIREAYLFMQKNKWFNIGRALTEHLFQQVIREVNNQLSYELIEGNSIVLPEQMGTLEVKRKTFKVYKKDGKVKNNYYIDWDKTLELWYNDKEAYDNRTLVRDVLSDYGVFVDYNKDTAKYKNKCFMQFRANRAIERVLSKKAKQHNIEAFSYGRIY